MLSNSSKLHKYLTILGIVGWVFLGFTLAQALGIALITSLRWLGVPLGDINDTVFTTIANIIVYSLALVIIIGVPLKLKKWPTTLTELGLARGPVWKDLLWLVAGAGVYITLTVVVTTISRILIPGADYEQTQQTGFTYMVSGWEMVLAFLSLVVVAPVAEELIFRGYMAGKLLKYRTPVWLIIVLTAALFAVAHGQFNVALDTFSLGVVLCFMRIYSGSVWASIFLHALKNGVAFYFLFVNPVFL